MGLLDKLGHVALDAIDMAARYAERASERKRSAAPPKEVPAEPEATSTTPDAPATPEPELGDPEIPVQIYGRMSCPFTQRALRLLETRDIEHVYTELARPGGYALVPRLTRETGQRTVPYVYLRGRFVGGYDALDEIERLGQLDEMIKTDTEREASAGSRRVQIRIPPRNDR